MRITSTGGISFGSTGTAYGGVGQILKSNGNASPTWIDGSAIPGVPGGSGTGNYLARWTPNGDTLGIGVVYDNGTNVGIGIDDPAARLEVKSNLYVSHPNAEEITFRLDNYGATGTDAGPLLRMFNQSGTTVVNIDSRSGSSRDTYFNQGGNFGIGETGPAYKLHVNSGTTNNVAIFESSDGGGVITVKDSAGEVAFSNIGNNIYFKTSSSQSNKMAILNSGAIQFNAYGAGVLVTDASGNITASTSPPVDGITFNNGATITNQINTDVDTGTETIASVATATHDSAFFDFVIKKGLNVRSGTVYACHDGDTTPLVAFTETSTQDLGDTSDVTLSVVISGTNMELQATTTSDNWSIKSLIRAI
jgi:hypothetical protein